MQTCSGDIMSKICIILITVLAFALPVSAQEEEFYSEEYNSCEGTWMLHKGIDWTVTRIEDGLTAVIPATAAIFDCGRQPGELQEHMNNVKAVVRCSNSSEQKGESHVEEIQIICE